MHCGHCGKQVEDDARFCPSCGARMDGQEPPEEGGATAPESPYHTSGGSQAPPRTSYDGPAPHIKNYLVESILCTICCCLPFGIPGIVFAAQVDSKLKGGDVEGAIESSEKAKKWTLVSFVLGLIANIIAIISSAGNIGDTWF